MTSLAHRVRGEFVPIDEGSLHLLEVVYDGQHDPFWKARCLQTGKVLSVALDGAVQQAIASNLNLGGIDYLNQRRRSRSRRRVMLVLLSFLLAGLAFVYRDLLILRWEEVLTMLQNRMNARP